MSKLVSNNNLKYEVLSTFTIIPNGVFYKFNCEEIGVICYMASKSKSHTFVKSEICKDLSLSVKKLNEILKSLIKSEIISRVSQAKFTFSFPTFYFVEPPKKKEPPFNIEDYQEEILVIRHLNSLSKVNTKENNQKALKSIKNLQKNKYTISNITNVIDLKSKEWVDTENEKFFRHQTLFKLSNFEKYYKEFELSKVKNKTAISQNFKEKTEKQIQDLSNKTIDLSSEQIKSSQEKANSIIEELERKKK
jgi:uncharacterized phage protein (TIGR02220 family)